MSNKRQYYCPVKVFQSKEEVSGWRFCAAPLPCKAHDIEDELDGAQASNGIVLFDTEDLNLRRKHHDASGGD